MLNMPQITSAPNHPEVKMGTPGLVYSGTSDTIACLRFMKLLQELDPVGADCVEEMFQDIYRPHTLLQRMPRIQEMLVELHEALNDCAPEGYFFGRENCITVEEGVMVGYGFWYIKTAKATWQ